MNILICMPAYGGAIQINTVNSLLDFHKMKIPFTLMCIGSESLITRARNTCISYFYALANELELTHLFWLDADIGFTGESLIKLVSHNKDFCSAAVALKGFTPEGKSVYNMGNFIKQEGDLISVDMVGGAVVLISRKCVNSLIEGAETYEYNKYTRGGIPITMYNVYQTAVKDGVYLSEDFFICDKLRKLGYEIWVDPTLRATHAGMWQFS